MAVDLKDRAVYISLPLSNDFASVLSFNDFCHFLENTCLAVCLYSSCHNFFLFLSSLNLPLFNHSDQISILIRLRVSFLSLSFLSLIPSKFFFFFEFVFSNHPHHQICHRLSLSGSRLLFLSPSSLLLFVFVGAVLIFLLLKALIEVTVSAGQGL